MGQNIPKKISKILWKYFNQRIYSLWCSQLLMKKIRLGWEPKWVGNLGRENSPQTPAGLASRSSRLVIEIGARSSWLALLFPVRVQDATAIFWAWLFSYSKKSCFLTKLFKVWEEKSAGYLLFEHVFGWLFVESRHKKQLFKNKTKAELFPKGNWFFLPQMKEEKV